MLKNGLHEKGFQQTPSYVVVQAYCPKYEILPKCLAVVVNLMPCSAFNDISI